VCHTLWCQVMKPQPKMAKEPPHEWMRGDPKPGEVEGDEGDDLRLPGRRL
jgi:hypothetical protein